MWERERESNIVTLIYGDREWEYDFEKNTVAETNS